MPLISQVIQASPSVNTLTGGGTVHDFGAALNAAVWRAWNVQYATTATTGAINATIDVPGGMLATPTNIARIQQMVTNSVNELTWNAWNVTYTATTANVTGGTLEIQANAIATNSMVWTVWNDRYEQYVQRVGRQVASGARPSEEEVQARMRQEQEWRRQQEEGARRATEAKSRAELLLRAHLSPEQREDLDKKGCFYVAVRGQKYQITRGRSGNVKLLDDRGQVRRSFCVHPGMAVPDADTMLAQKLLLETCIEDFYRLANVTEYEAGRSNYFGAPRGLELLRAADDGELPQPANDQQRAA